MGLEIKPCTHGNTLTVRRCDMRLQVLSNNRLSLVEGGQTTSILGGRMSLRISPTELRPEVMFTPDCKLPSSFLIWDEVTSDRDNALRYRSWQPLRTDTSIVIHEGDSRHEVRIVVEPDEPADDPDSPF
ncbi:MAG: hypothetical protein UW41_C0012G0028 [Candidatus Collierbacteria bacterium GW2011_GWC2_44_18]|uniref:Uncharacterized protein n=1 Tax=Candidatus Collierbacteria bacterium GW2011_GWC2_44_18 TaxID=1618392 RepID=A0A0G1HQA7_9BACT|nr:MAG: hypothetical protein UW16_C0031G0036 [Microgenomates group bacterium GW2011_GWC1_44_10]KKT49090.1 MAG: hypothetical protein UW41_C0012G0028 [Candidatus Collierbacteria bacterium GW2011_GWC2_44_18]